MYIVGNTMKNHSYPLLTCIVKLAPGLSPVPLDSWSFPSLGDLISVNVWVSAGWPSNSVSISLTYKLLLVIGTVAPSSTNTVSAMIVGCSSLRGYQIHILNISMLGKSLHAYYISVKG